MVKHGRNKKRRAGRIGKTKLKNRTYHRWNPNPKFTDPTIRQYWDPSKSPSMNLANLGLRSDMNQDVLPGRSNNVEKLIAKDVKDQNGDGHLIELFDIPDSDELQKQKLAKREAMKIDDQKYICTCLAKYGMNYTKMARDTRGVNYMQLTQTQLSKLGSRFLLLNPNQIQLEDNNIPDSVKVLMHDDSQE